MNLHPDMMSEGTGAIDISDITDIEIEGVDPADYPKFCDAFFSSATWKHDLKELTEDELDALTDQYPEVLNQMAVEACIGE